MERLQETDLTSDEIRGIERLVLAGKIVVNSFKAFHKNEDLASALRDL